MRRRSAVVGNVRHKGIGEGRRYFTELFRDTLKNSRVASHRRNVEILARGLINHVRLLDEYRDYVSDDVVPYQRTKLGMDIFTHGRDASLHRSMER